MTVSITRDHGMLKVDINGTLYAPLSFKSFRPNPQNISEFYKAGVRLFSVLSSGIISALGVPYSKFGESWIGENSYDFSAIDRQMDMFIENAPDGYFAPMFQLDTRPWYLAVHPEVPNSFTHLSQIATDAAWKQAAANYLKAAICHCEEKYGERIYGYFMLGGTTTEWFSNRDHEASHPIKEEGYKKYLGTATAALPTIQELTRAGGVFLENEEENVFHARRFHAESIADLVLYFASEAQSVLHHKKLLGLYYGYLFELGGERLFNDGHLGYERVFLSPDIDMISSPSAYGYRKLDDPSAFMVTQKTLDAHNKLYFLEFDHITHIAPTMVAEPCVDANGNAALKKIPGADSKCRDAAESLNLMWRDYILCYANGAAMWWFDMFDGWFRSDEMMGAIEKMISLHQTLSGKEKQSIAQIAVYAEGESMYHVRKSSGIATVCLSDMRRSFTEMGAPYDLYSIADLDTCSSGKYRLIILLNAYEIPEARMKKIRKLQNDGAAVLWMYAPDYAHDRKNCVRQISEAVGMKVAERDKSHGGLVYSGTVIENKVAAPYFSIEDQHAIVLAYFEDGAAAVAATRDGSSIYAAVPFMPSQLLRDLVRKKGIFVYSTNPSVYTYVNADAVCVYNASDTDAVLFVPLDGVYIDQITNEAFTAERGILRLPLRGLRAYLLMRNTGKQSVR